MKSTTSKPPEWLARALGEAQIADRMCLTIHEIRWINTQHSPISFRMLRLYLKSNYRIWRRESNKPSTTTE